MAKTKQKKADKKAGKKSDKKKAGKKSAKNAEKKNAKKAGRPTVIEKAEQSAAALKTVSRLPDEPVAAMGQQGAAVVRRTRAGATAARTAAASKARAASSRTRAAAPKTATATTRTRAAAPKSRAELYEIAKQRDLPGRSTMSRDELARALGEK
jgi:hypothetical protein